MLGQRHGLLRKIMLSFSIDGEDFSSSSVAFAQGQEVVSGFFCDRDYSEHLECMSRVHTTERSEFLFHWKK